MKYLRKPVIILCLCTVGTVIHAQNTIPATGGEATGTGGSSISFTAGQIAYSLKSASTWTVAEGVQQPWEISVQTSVENSEDITLEYKVFPNPAHEYLKLTVKPFDNKDLRYRLYNNKGILILDKKAESEETLIPLDGLLSAVYFLKILRDNREVKVFKIVKI